MQQLVFEIGHADHPRGHALVYYRDELDNQKLYATYIVVFPITVNLSKYVPPFLAGSLGATDISEISSVPMPPVPEECETYERLIQLAQSRGDDLIYGGIQSAGDIPAAMNSVNEIAQRYTAMWKQFDDSQQLILPEAVEEGVAVNEVMYSLLSEHDKLNELSQLIVRLRFASEGHDTQLQRETQDEIHTLVNYLPARYDMERFVPLALDTSETTTKLTQLYMERMYGLSNGDTDRVRRIDLEIKAIEGSV